MLVYIDFEKGTDVNIHLSFILTIYFLICFETKFKFKHAYSILVDVKAHLPRKESK